MSGNSYYLSQSAAQLRAALAQDIPALYASVGGAGTVTSVGLTSTDLTVSGSPVSTAGTITADLVTQGGVVGSYTYASLTINSKGIVTAASNGAAPAASANPSATLGLTAVNGAASTYMRSDAAPALNQGIAPTWTSQHVFSAGGGSGTGASVAIVTAGNPNWCLSRTTNGVDSKTWECIMNATQLIVRAVNDANSASSFALSITRSAATISAMAYGNSTDKPPHTFFGAVGINGVSPPAQPTGYGTPTGGAHQASFAAGSITLPNLAAAVAQLIIELKAYGLIGA